MNTSLNIGFSSTTTGGRARVRRWCTVLLLSIGLGLPQWTTSAASTDVPPQVDVREDEGVYRVTARFTVPESSSAVFAVLTDYEHIPRFIPDMRTSKVLDRAERHATVEQETVVHLLMFSKRIHLVLDVLEGPRTIRFRDLCGRSFERYEGAWTLADTDQGSAITYELVANPSFSVPKALLRRMFERDATQMIDRLRAEIAARVRRSST
jgi:ribosome-associated toxin RatA of RatAB toxin-antitoxin module